MVRMEREMSRTETLTITFSTIAVIFYVLCSCYILRSALTTEVVTYQVLAGVIAECIIVASIIRQRKNRR